MRLLLGLLKTVSLLAVVAVVVIKLVYDVSWKEAVGIAEEFLRDASEDLTS